MRPGRQERGVVLIVALWGLVVLSLLALGLARRTHLDLKLACLQIDQQRVHYVARAGVEHALAVLAREDDNAFDSLNEPWGRFRWDDVEDTALDLSDWPGADGLKVHCRIVDERSKIDLNHAPPEMLASLSDDPNFDVVVNAITEWRTEDGKDGTEAQQQHEGDEQEDAGPRKGYFGLVEEILFLEGATQAMLDAALPSSAQGDASGLRFRDVVTVHADGRINLNTAPRAVLERIPGLQPHILSMLLEHRAGPDREDGTDDDRPFETLRELRDLPGMDQYNLSQLAAFAAIKSDVYSIVSEAEVPSKRVRARIRVLVDKSTDPMTILAWFED